jgi:hypothetical protein
MADELPEIPVVLPSNPYAPHTGGTPIPVSSPQVGDTKRQASAPLPEIPVSAPGHPAPTAAPPQVHGGLPEIPVTAKPGGNPLTNFIKERTHTAQQAGRALATYESGLFGAWKNAMGAGVEADLNLLGTPQRVISGEVENVQNHANIHDSINHLGEMVWHPTPERIKKARTAVQKGLGLATDADIDTMMHGTLMHHLGQLSPFVGNALKTINNVGIDTITDPFSWAGDAATAARDLGLGEHLEAAPSATHMIAQAARHAAVNPATKPLIHAGVTAGRIITGQVYNLLVKHGAGPAFEHLKTAVAGTKNSASNIYNGLHDAMVVRPDLLHAGLTPAGRDVRIQLENSQRVLKQKDWLEKGGENISEEDLQDLNKFHASELARKSNQVFSEQGGTKLSHVPNPMDWRKYQAPRVKAAAEPAKTMANLGRAGIELNPLPHGIGNVGTLQFLGGGLDAVTRGVAAMVKPVDEAIKGRLIQGGSAVPDYIGHHTGGVPGYKEAVNAMSGLLGQMEYGWRAGMLEHLDRVLGPSEAGTKAEYIKMALINKKLGDYHNLTAFARAFASYGGPYVAYKLGVLPKAVLDSVRNNPINFETVARTEGQVQQNRQGAYQNKLSMSDPVSETGEMTTNPVGYLVNTAMMGFMKDGFELANDWANPSETRETFDQGIAKIAENHIAPLGMIAGAMENAQGKSFAGQPMSFADHMAAVIMGGLNAHIHKFPSQKAERKNERFIEKHAFTPED